VESLRRLCETLNVSPSTLLGMSQAGDRSEPLLDALAGRLRAANEGPLPDLLQLLREAEAEARELKAHLSK